MSTWFDESFYLASKAEQVNEIFKTHDWNALLIKQAILDAGFATIEEHYKKFGAYESSVNPNRNFDDDKYYADKAAQLNATDPQKSNYTSKDVSNYFQEHGISPVEHYLNHGKSEGLKAKPVTGTEDVGWQNPSAETLLSTLLLQTCPPGMVLKAN